jgi:hypothetical protein
VSGFDPDALLEVLHRHEVRYVLIGGLAAALRGSATPTFDVDITPAAGAANLGRLSAALKELDARIRVDRGTRRLPVLSRRYELVTDDDTEPRHPLRGPGHRIRSRWG